MGRRPDGTLAAHKLLLKIPSLWRCRQGIRNLLGLNASEPIPPGLVGAVKMGTGRHQCVAGARARTLLVTTKVS